MFNSLHINKLYLFSFLGVYLSLLVGCGITKRTATPSQAEIKQTSEGIPDPVTGNQKRSPLPLSMNISSAEETNIPVKRQLQIAHEVWQGTPYKHGGESSSGIDCSAFTQQVFRDYFEKQLPRNTRNQLQEGNGVRRGSIKTGDLIFFKTGRKTLHVGISLGEGDFLHASVTSGVMISNVSERYWATRYLAARRVL